MTNKEPLREALERLVAQMPHGRKITREMSETGEETFVSEHAEGNCWRCLLEAALRAPSMPPPEVLTKEYEKAKKLWQKNTPEVDPYAHQYWGGFCDAMAMCLAAPSAAPHEDKE